MMELFLMKCFDLKKIRFLMVKTFALVGLLGFVGPISRVEADLHVEVSQLIRSLSVEYRKNHPVVTPEQQARAYREVAWQAIDFIPHLESVSREDARHYIDLLVFMAKNGPDYLKFPMLQISASHATGYINIDLADLVQTDPSRQRPFFIPSSSPLADIWSHPAPVASGLNERLPANYWEDLALDCAEKGISPASVF
jgi:hypothetical protein